MNPVTLSLIKSVTHSEQLINRKDNAKCHTGVDFASLKEIPLSPIKKPEINLRKVRTTKKRSTTNDTFNKTTAIPEENASDFSIDDKVHVTTSVPTKPMRKNEKSYSYKTVFKPFGESSGSGSNTDRTMICQLEDNNRKWRFYNIKYASCTNLPSVKANESVKEDNETSIMEELKEEEQKPLVKKPIVMVRKSSTYGRRGEATPKNKHDLPKKGSMELLKSLSMKNLRFEEREQKPVYTSNNFLQEIRQTALNTIIDKKEEDEASETSSLELKRPPTGKDFVIKSARVEKTEQKSIVYPSSLSHIPSLASLGKDKNKRYRFKEPKSASIFCSLKNKTELFNDIMSDRSSMKKLTQGSLGTISTASSEFKSSLKAFNDDSKYYFADKTKKCVRAKNVFGDLTGNVKGYVGNLDSKDPGMKKVRFVEDLKDVKNTSEIVLYRGFDDKRDFKDFKRKLIKKCWETNVESKK